MHGDIVGFREPMMDQYHSTEGPGNTWGQKGPGMGWERLTQSPSQKLVDFFFGISSSLMDRKSSERIGIPNFLRLDLDSELSLV